MTVATDPTGPLFLSYRRTRAADVAMVVRALHDRGVPTWLDTTSLLSEPTGDELRRVIGDLRTSSAILYLTADVAGSATIRKVEAPAILCRHRVGDGFWVQPVAAGGLDYQGAADTLAGNLGTEDLTRWNIARFHSDPASVADAEDLARRCLARRLAAIHAALPPADPVQLVLHARGTPTPAPGAALVLDWTPRFADPFACDDWQALATAVRDVAAAIRAHCPDRNVIATGTPAMPASLLLGSAFPTRDAAQLSWRQRQPDGALGPGWHLAAADARDTADARWIARAEGHDAAADACAVLVNVNDDTTGAFAASHATLPDWGTVIEVGRRPGQSKAALSAPENASLARLVIDEIRGARAS